MTRDEAATLRSGDRVELITRGWTGTVCKTYKTCLHVRWDQGMLNILPLTQMQNVRRPK